VISPGTTITLLIVLSLARARVKGVTHVSY
jgi:hypothetical protein